jgi:hydrogenase nickel incorporation protein HypA/HybF
MHEGHFTEQIVDAIIQELEKYPGRKPKRVNVKVGEIYHLVPESVLLHYEYITKGTPLQGVALQLSQVPVQVKCNACSQSGPVEDHHMLMCSHCRSLDVYPIAGNNVTIEGVELEPL